MSKKEKLKHLDAEMKKAKEQGNEIYLEYIIKIKKLVIKDFDTLTWQSGSPPPLPPYKP